MTTPRHRYTFRVYNGRVKVAIDGVLMLAFNQLDFKGLYAYKDDTCLYGIDLYLKDTTMETYYKTRVVWTEMLKLLDENL